MVRRTTWFTPGTCFAAASSQLLAVPPNTGERATTATSMFGTCTSMPKVAAPRTLLGVSRRWAGVPMSLKSFGSLSVTFSGTGSAAARSASSPYLRRRRLEPWITTPFSVLHSAASTVQAAAAAETSMARAFAPASRSGSQAEATLVLPPVTCEGKIEL